MVMALANTIISVVGDLLVLITLIVAVKALNIANGARADALTADETASKERGRAADREIESVRLASELLEQSRAAAKRPVIENGRLPCTAKQRQSTPPSGIRWHRS